MTIVYNYLTSYEIVGRSLSQWRKQNVKITNFFLCFFQKRFLPVSNCFSANIWQNMDFLEKMQEKLISKFVAETNFFHCETFCWQQAMTKVQKMIFRYFSKKKFKSKVQTVCFTEILHVLHQKPTVFGQKREENNHFTWLFCHLR